MHASTVASFQMRVPCKYEMGLCDGVVRSMLLLRRTSSPSFDASDFILLIWIPHPPPSQMCYSSESCFAHPAAGHFPFAWVRLRGTRPSPLLKTNCLKSECRPSRLCHVSGATDRCRATMSSITTCVRIRYCVDGWGRDSAGWVGMDGQRGGIDSWLG